MHGSGGSSDGKKRARIEIIPLIDVIFFLLATFVLFTLSLNKSEGVQVEMPTSSTGIPRDTDKTVTISVTKLGTIAWWREEPILLEDFISRVKDMKIRNPDWRILINGDRDAEFSKVVYVFDEVRKAGFRKIFVETRYKKPGS
jgi:biopolymer transport protein ExbD